MSSAPAFELMPGSPPGGLLRIDTQSMPKPPSGIEVRSWFVLSRPVEPGFITDAARFEVYDGQTFEVLHGFPGVDTLSIGVSADPARTCQPVRRRAVP